MTTSLLPQLVRFQDSIAPASINGVINGAIAWMSLRSHEQVPVSLDLISTTEHSVWGQGVMLAFFLGLILSVVTAKIFAKHLRAHHPDIAPLADRPVFPDLARIALRNTMVLFGAFVVAAVLWQRLVGTVCVSPVLAALLVAGLAALITILIERWTKLELLRPAP
jgi:hypothetical protein